MYHTNRNLLKRALLALLAFALLAQSALAVSLERGTIVLLTDLNGRLVGGGEIERDGDLDFEILRNASGELRFSVHYRDGTVLIYDAFINDSNRLVIEGAEGSYTLQELARSHRLDLDYDRESELDDDIICIVPRYARSDAWPYGEDCD